MKAEGLFVMNSKLKYKFSAYLYGKKGIYRMLCNLGCNLSIIKNCYNPCKKSCKMTNYKKIRKI